MDLFFFFWLPLKPTKMGHSSRKRSVSKERPLLVQGSACVSGDNLGLDRPNLCPSKEKSSVWKVGNLGMRVDFNCMPRVW